MLKYFFFLLAAGLISSLSLQAQLDFKNDGTFYPTLEPGDLCRFLKDHPGALLIDVRTPGEFADTCIYGSLNIGHLKGAVSYPIDSIENYLSLLPRDTLHPLIIYCSHSQRSRRVNKLLHEKGFLNHYNLNGGMSYMIQLGKQQFPCGQELIVHATPYIPMSGVQALQWLKTTRDRIILDIRPAFTFAGTDSMAEENIGRIKGSINIPFAELSARMAELDKNKPVLVCDAYGTQSDQAARWLTEQGFARVYRLVPGICAFMGWEESTLSDRRKILEALPPYTLLNTGESIRMVESGKVLVMDTRSVQEFTNTAPQRWRNQGRIKGAVNLPPDRFDDTLTVYAAYKNKPVLVYGNDDGAKYARKLVLAGFRKVYLQYDGMWGFLYARFNIVQLKERVAPLLENHEGLY